MKHRRPLTVLALTLLTAVACADSEEDVDEVGADEESAMEATTEAAGTAGPAFSEEVRTEFRPLEGSDSAVTGTLRLLVPVQPAEAEHPRIHVELAGLTPGPHAWHIHGGPCDVDAPVEVPISTPAGEEQLADPLEAGPDGRVTAEVRVPALSQLWVEAGAYSVHVHERAGTDHGATVACAVL